MNPYDDIINLPHHVSSTHPQMSPANRAAQFSPFAALTGYDEAINEAARITERRIELDENALYTLDMKLGILADVISDRPEVAITYFRPDEKKAGGEYVTATDVMKMIDEYEGSVVLMSGERIAITDILDIECEVFRVLL